ncbi:Type II secretion system protein D precursor [compost metagenome]
MSKQRLLVATALTVMLAGCATPFATQNQARTMAEARATNAVQDFVDQAKRGRVREISEPMVEFKRTAAPVQRGDVYVRAAATPFAPLVSELSKKAGLSVAFADGVDAMRKVTVDFNGAFTEDAIRTTAFMAGYAAVIDRDKNTVYIADRATYNYRLPSAVFKSLQAQYNVGGDPANSSKGSGGSGGSGGGGGGASGGTSLKAEFTIAGKEGTNGAGLQKFMTDLAGRNAEVLVTDQGVVSVRGNAQALRRMNDFIKNFAYDAMTQVEIEASVIEVSLERDFNLGIQWGKVLNGATKGFYAGGTPDLAAATVSAAGGNPNSLIGLAASQASQGGIGGYRTSASTASIINALMQFTDVNIVSQPKLVSLNNNPATFFDGTQVPYLGSVEQTSGTGDNAPTVSGSVSFAIDGVSFSAVPSVVNKSSVQITLLPVLSSVGEFSQFLNGQLTAPTQANKQTYMRVLAENGKTLILGGIRYNKDIKGTSYGASTSARASSKEVVILLRANVVPPSDNDIIMSESL